MSDDNVHATAVVIGDRGVLIRGASGSGKSSLALELLTAFGARAALVADDRVVLAAAGGRLVASAPAAIAGALEIRGLGIVRRPYVSPAVIDLVVDLVAPADCPRLPDEAEARVSLAGVSLPRLFLPPGAGAAEARIGAALALIDDPSWALTL